MLQHGASFTGAIAWKYVLNTLLSYMPDFGTVENVSYSNEIDAPYLFLVLHIILSV